jgi:hypothetical protein
MYRMLNNKQLNDIKLWIVSKRCKDFEYKTILSIIDKFENGTTLTDKQEIILESIYEKCEIARKVYYLTDYEVEHIGEMEVDTPIICNITKTECKNWTLFKDGVYISQQAFIDKVDNEMNQALEKQTKRKFVSKAT